MSFDSIEAFLAMGGHGLYVWLSYGAALIILLYNVISARVAERRFFAEARDRQRRHAEAGPVRQETGAGQPLTGESSRS